VSRNAGGQGKPLEVFIVAGETSGDLLGAGLMAALRACCGGKVRFRGVGGPAMAAEGLESLFPLPEIAIIGFSGLLTGTPRIFRRVRETAEAALAARTDVLVIVDAPDFTHRVARRVRAADPSIAIVDYVSPTVWAWRPGRARAMRAYVDRVLALLPFEPEVHRKLGGPPCTYIGHPIAERAAALRPSAAELQRRMADPARLLVLPGSRHKEIARLAPVFGATLGRVAAQGVHFEAIVPTLPALRPEIEAAVASWPVPAHIVTERAEIDAAFRAARAALAASGTVTLELAVAGVPSVVAYRLSYPEAAIAWLMIRVPSIVLANIVLGENAMPEFLQSRARAALLAPALARLLKDTPERERQVEAFKKLDTLMGIGGEAPSARAARAVIETFETKTGRKIRTASS
jgi:lipid-A-disaccharide synthase